ncbi:MAG: hypothetical protein V4479_16180 [Actinomycetota bacterium]
MTFAGAVGAPAQAAVQAPAAHSAPTAVHAPAAHSAPTGVSANSVVAGAYYSCGLKVGGAAECWGAGGGQSTPPSGSFYVLAAGYDFACGILDDGDTTDGGAITCWGSTEFGQGTAPSGSDFIQISAAAEGEQVCARRVDWTVACWGGYTDVPSTTDHFYSIALGTDFGCGILSGGSISCWGWDGSYHVVSGAPSGSYDHIAASNTYACAVSSSDRSISCWGQDLNSRLSSPSGTFFDMAMTNAGGCGIQYPSRALTCWGTGPSAISGTYLSITGGFGHYCALGSSTTKVACWGDNSSGQVQPGLSSGSVNLLTGVAANFSIPLTHISPAPSISVTGTLPGGLSRTGLQVSGTPTTVETQTLTVSTSSSIIPFEQNLDLVVTLGPVASYTLRLSDPTPVQGETVTFAVEAFDGVGNSVGDFTGPAILTSDVPGDAQGSAFGTFTFAGLDPAAHVTSSVVHTITVGSYSNSITDDVPVTVSPLVASVHLTVNPTSAAVHGTAAATLVGLNAGGSQVADLTSYSTFTSNKPADSITGDVITLSAETGTHQISASYGTLSDSTNLSATPGPLATLELTPSATTANTGGALSLAVEGFDADGNTLGGLTSSATFSSSVAGDQLSASGIIFTFDPSARATTSTVHTVTATIGAVSDSVDITVAPLVTAVTVEVSATSAFIGDTVTVTVEGLDSHGDPVADLSSDVVVTSDQNDIVSGNHVTFVHASPHVITATYGTLSTSKLVEVSPLPAALGSTGADIVLPLGVMILLLALGVLALLFSRYRAGRLS